MNGDDIRPLFEWFADHALNEPNFSRVLRNTKSNCVGEYYCRINRCTHCQASAFALFAEEMTQIMDRTTCQGNLSATVSRQPILA